MNQRTAMAVVSRLAAGLAPEPSGVARLLERIAQRDNAEILRAALMERGAEALLDLSNPPKETRHGR